MTDPVSNKSCIVCYAVELPKNRLCGQCKAIRYCSQDCQAIDWQRHKIDCLFPSKIKMNVQNEPKKRTQPIAPFFFQVTGRELRRGKPIYLLGICPSLTIEAIPAPIVELFKNCEYLVCQAPAPT